MIRAFQSELANHELVTAVLLLLGGKTRPVDREDIAMKANQRALAGC
ncbi:MAG: hypothetical protein IPM17_16500 [Verrucomicrobia bacterium]|nr:hypothetical protein [Verrucomicrobiota bacterium]